MEKNEQILKEGSFRKMVMNLCVPTIVIMLVMVLYNMADTYFIGKTGDPCKIAAVSLCGPIFSILSGLGTLLGSGGCTAVSLAFGKKEFDKIRAYSSMCCYGALTMGLIFAGAVLINAPAISDAIGANADTMSDTCTYLRILAIGGPVILFGNVFNNLIRADGSAKQSMLANGLGTIVNIILDPILILGFHLDVAGAAIATVLGNVVTCLYLLWYIAQKNSIFSLHIKDFSLKREIVFPVVTLGFPMACSTILMSISHMVMNQMLAGYGSVAVAANGVAGKVSMVVSMTAMGICMGMQPAISYNCGAGNYKRLYWIIKKLGIMTVVVGSILTVGCVVGRTYLVAAFIHHAQVIELGEKMVFVSMVIGPFYGLYQLCTTFLQSTGKASYATLVAVLNKGLIYLPLLLIFNSLWGLNGVIYTAPVTDMLSLLVGAGLCIRWNRIMVNGDRGLSLSDV